ncbi:MAG: EpsG family protein [Rikenellaceae bacterium]
MNQFHNKLNTLYIDFSCWRYLIIGFLFFILAPVIGVIFSIVQIVRLDKVPKYMYSSLFLMLSIWMGLINYTIDTSMLSDLGAYIQYFEDVPISGVAGILSMRTEPLYNIITYIGYYVCFGNPLLFFSLLSVVMYMLLLKGMYLIFRKENFDKYAILCGVMTLCFFTQYFVLTAHLVRQVLAVSITIYALCYRAAKGKHCWALLVAAPLIHTSSLFFVLLSLVPVIYTRLNIFKLSIILLGVAVVVVFNTFIGGLFGTANYAVDRFSSNATDGGELDMSLAIIVFIPFFFICIKQLWQMRNIKYNSLYSILYVCLITMVFILSFTQNPLIQYRFFFMLYALIPLILPLASYGFSKEWHIAYSSLASIFFFVRFVTIHNTSGFHYADIWELLLLPLFFNLI